jgi:hypothetical protein
MAKEMPNMWRAATAGDIPDPWIVRRSTLNRLEQRIAFNNALEKLFRPVCEQIQRYFAIPRVRDHWLSQVVTATFSAAPI